MGGNGARLGVSVKGKPYGTEYETLHTYRNIKFVRYIDASSARVPLETMTHGRIYATVNADNKVKFITYYDKENKKHKEIDVIGQEHELPDGRKIIPHTHLGYYHDERGTRELTEREKRMVDRVTRIWYNYIAGK